MYQPTQRLSPTDEIQGDKLLWAVGIINLIALILPVIVIDAILIRISISWFEFLSPLGVILYLGGIGLNFLAATKIKEKPSVKRFNLSAGLLFSFLLLAVFSELSQLEAIPDYISINLGLGGVFLILGTIGSFVSSIYAKNITKIYFRDQIRFQQPQSNQMYQPNSQPNENLQLNPYQSTPITNQEDSFCTACGTRSSVKSDSFCNNCGNKLRNGSQS